MTISKGFLAIGSTVEATTEVPSDELPATYAALTGWVESNEETSLGDSGATNSVVTFNTVRNGQVNKRVSFTDSGQYQLSYAFNVDDPMQILLKAGAKSKALHTFRETLSDGTVSYFQAYISSATKSPSDGSTVVMFKSALEITSEIQEVVAV